MPDRNVRRWYRNPAVIVPIIVATIGAIGLIIAAIVGVFVDNTDKVESEFAKDSHQAIIDFSKLVLGSAENKLFIAPLVYDSDAFIQVLLEPARHCNGEVYLALVPHPNDWDKADDEIRVYQLVENQWKRMN